MAINSTFPINMMNQKENFPSEEKRVALNIRDHMHNAKAHGATKAIILNMSNGDKHAVVFGHNGNIFDGQKNQMNCLRPSVSGGGGVQGNGPKATAFLLVEKNEEMELVFCNHGESEDYASSLTCVNFNNAKITDATCEWIPPLKEVMGDLYNEYRVFYINRYVNSNSKEERKSLERNKDKGLVRREHLKLATELCPDLFDEIEVKAFANFIFGKQEQWKHLQDKRTAIICVPSQKEQKDAYCADSLRLTMDFDYEYDNPRKVLPFTAQVIVDVYPNVRVPTGEKTEGTRQIILNGPYVGRIHRNHLNDSKESLFVHCDFQIECEKDVSRAANDPYYTSSQNYDLLAILGLYCPKNRRFDGQIKEYWSEFMQKNDVNIIRWEPYVKVTIRLKPHLKNAIHQCGGLNEFFYAVDPHKVRDIVNAFFQKIAQQNPQELIEFRKRMQKHYPYDRNEDLAPVLKYVCGPEHEQGGKYVIRVLKDGVVLREVQPGETLNFVKLEFSDGRILTEPLRDVTKGFTVTRVNPNDPQDNTYNIYISPLVRVSLDDKGNIVKTVPVSPEEYHCNDNYLPKSHNHAFVETDLHSFSCRVQIPKREGNGGGGKSTLGRDKVTAEVDDIYREMHTELYGMYINGKLILNKCNPKVVQMASFNREQFPTLYKRYMNFYAKARKICSIIAAEYEDCLEVDYKKAKKYDLEEIYTDPKHFYVNSHLALMFEETEEAIMLIKDVTATKS